MAQAKKNVETKQQGTALAETGGGSEAMVLLQDNVPDYLQGAMGSTRGNENVGTDDLVIPRLEVVQGLSKALEEGHANFIQGAKPGDLINSVTRRNYGREVFVVPVHYSKQFLVWKDIKKGGGFFGAFPDPAAAQSRADEEGGTGESTGIEIIDTPVHLVLLLDRETGKVDEMMMSMPRTKAKISRQWNSIVKLAGGDRFTRVYRVGTQLEEKSGQKYWNFAIAQSGFPAKSIFQRAEKLFAEVKAGRTRTMDVRDFEESADLPGDGGETGTGGM